MRALLFAMILLASSQVPLRADAVRDEVTAISIAKKACAAHLKASHDLQWEATFHDGVWKVSAKTGVRLIRPYPHGVDVRIRASDGTPDECNEYITVY